MRIIILGLLLCSTALQSQPFTRQDTLRGAITEERVWWDLQFYHLDIAVDPTAQTIEGSNTIRFKAIDRGKRVMQVDLQPPLEITRITQDGQEVSYQRDGNAYFVTLAEEVPLGSIGEIVVYYGGAPRVARRPPWDGGLTWEKDSNGNHFIANSNQGIGASIWWPCKDHMYDEPDSMRISVNVPEDLMDVSNGRLEGIEDEGDGTVTYHWFVSNPINNYGVNISIGDYVHWSEVYQGEKGPLDVDYYPLRENEEAARSQFRQVPMMLEAFEHWFGPYPFYEDGFKLVEVPYLGMEHQSAVTYGNQYQNGYLGRDGSGSGWGLKFDFIIIHESGHEWFANNITYKDVADMWIHESFTNYSESLYIEYHFGKEAGAEYVVGTRRGIRNDRPIIGTYHVNQRGSGDMYSKGGNMLHTIRQVVNNDEKWRNILRGLNERFYHSTVRTEEIETYMSTQAGIDLDRIFEQYLRDRRIPILEHYFDSDKLFYRWGNGVRGFDMPVRVSLDGSEYFFIQPEAGRWNSIDAPENADDLLIDINFYVAKMKVSGS